MSVADALVVLAWQALVVGALVGSIWLVSRFADHQGIGSALRERFHRGVPWGSLLVFGWVLGVYLFVQGGLWYPGAPLAIPFSAWSYFYPLGVLFAGFAHVGPGHLLSNFTTALVFAPLAEFVWGHYSDGDGRFTDPRGRAMVFTLGVLAVGLATSLFSWGPVIGFSGTVFALIGFALVRYPLVTVVALSVRSAIRTLIGALGDPVSVVEVTAGVSLPWWYGIAIQGHAIGFLIGVLAGIALLWRRRIEPDAARLWLGTLLVTLSLSLWAVWWVRGAETYVLYRALGVVLVLALSVLIAVALAATERPLIGEATARQAAAGALVVPLLVMCLVAVPLNLTTVEETTHDGAVTADDYTVFYDEEVENRMFSVVEIDAFGESTNVTTSGVIVTSDERHVWSREVSTTALETYGIATVRVGGLTWSEAIHVERTGWVVGDDRVYAVEFETDGERVQAYDSKPARADAVVDGRTITLLSESGEFLVEVEDANARERAALPDAGEVRTVNGISIANDDGRLVASDGASVVPIAERETYAPRNDDR